MQEINAEGRRGDRAQLDTISEYSCHFTLEKNGSVGECVPLWRYPFEHAERLTAKHASLWPAPSQRKSAAADPLWSTLWQARNILEDMWNIRRPCEINRSHQGLQFCLWHHECCMDDCKVSPDGIMNVIPVKKWGQVARGFSKIISLLQPHKWLHLAIWQKNYNCNVEHGSSPATHTVQLSK